MRGSGSLHPSRALFSPQVALEPLPTLSLTPVVLKISMIPLSSALFRGILPRGPSQLVTTITYAALGEPKTSTKIKLNDGVLCSGKLLSRLQ